MLCGDKITNKLTWPVRPAGQQKPALQLRPELLRWNKQFPKEVLLLIPLDLDLWHPKLIAGKRCKHLAAPIRFKCSC